MPHDVFQTLNYLSQQRYRAAIFHTTPDKSPYLTIFCKKICQNVNGKYLDLLEFFIQSQDLSKSIDTFNPEKLRDLFTTENRNQKLLVVDRVDFILDTWRKIERQRFYSLFNKQWDGFKEATHAILIVCLQTSQELETLLERDPDCQNRIFNLNYFNDIL